MAKIGKNNRISIPSEIMDLKGWDIGAELIFIPYNQDAETELTKDTPVIVKEVPKDGLKNKKKK